MNRILLDTPSVRSGLSVRQDDGKPAVLTGYAAVFYREGDAGTEYQPYPWDENFVERVGAQAFDAAIAGDDVRALFNHDASAVLGRNKSGTLRLSVDEVGLRYEIDMADTQLARDVRETVKRGDVSGSSFAFWPTSTTYSKEGKRLVRTLNKVTLFDVSPVTYPAYAGTDAQARSAFDPAKEARAEYERELAEAAKAAQPDAAARLRVDVMARAAELGV
jgi:HK97 family phage prohead protease